MFSAFLTRISVALFKPGLELLFGVRKSNASFVAVSRCLLSYGADVLKANDSGETPLDKCRGSEVEQLIRKIAARGGYSNALCLFLKCLYTSLPKHLYSDDIFILITSKNIPRSLRFSCLN